MDDDSKTRQGCCGCVCVWVWMLRVWLRELMSLTPGARFVCGGDWEMGGNSAGGRDWVGRRVGQVPTSWQN